MLPRCKSMKKEVNLFKKINLLINRIRVAGYSGIFLKFFKKTPSIFFKKNYKVYILGYNELIKDTLYSLIYKGYNTVDFNLFDNQKHIKQKL